MLLKCPKCGHPRAPGGGEQATCSACGLVFVKWAQRVLGQERIGRSASRERALGPEGRGSIARFLLPDEGPPDLLAFHGRCALFVALLLWGCYFVSLDLRSNLIGESFMHRVNLVFHEAGHVLFMPFGHFMMVLGGSLGQLLMPAIAGAALLLRNRDGFGASAALWWLGQSLMDLAPYINDARDLQLTLLGGGTGRDRPGVHDWENILLDLGLIEHERAIAAAADRLGAVLLLAGLAWGAAVLYRQYRQSRSGQGRG